MLRYSVDIARIDNCDPFPIPDNGNQYVSTVVDHFSGWPRAFTIKDQSTDTIAKISLKNFIHRHRCPILIISDQGTEYCNAVLHTVVEEIGISRIKTLSYHAQSNGQTERFNKFMNEMIVKKICENKGQ